MRQMGGLAIEHHGALAILAGANAELMAHGGAVGGFRMGLLRRLDIPLERFAMILHQTK
jgi:hypothetical protein